MYELLPVERGTWEESEFIKRGRSFSWQFRRVLGEFAVEPTISVGRQPLVRKDVQDAYVGRSHWHGPQFDSLT